MSHYRIEPLQDRDLPEASAFLERVRTDSPDVSKPVLLHSRRERVERRLRWRLLDNPDRVPGMELGQCLRGENGAIAGANLQFPGAFRLGDLQLLGLCGASFFVERDARVQGFFMFRRFMATKGVDFRFATTCNAQSVALWERLGGRPVPDSEYEYLLPLRLGPVLDEVLRQRGAPAVVRRVVTVAAALSAPALGARGRIALRHVEPCRDWTRLASAAEYNRPAERLTAARSAASLQWRFEQGPEASATTIYRFETDAGREGWFALRHAQRGRQGQIRTCVLLDCACPAADLDRARLIRTVVALVRPDTDLICLLGRSQTWLKAVGSKLRSRRFDAPKAICTGTTASGTPLADLLDLAPADGDAFD